MIKFHYHTAPKDVPRLGIRKGDPLCHVYSDRSLEELVAWGRERGFSPEWIDRRGSLPHFDAFGEQLRHCGEGVSRRELVEDLRSWRRGEADRGGGGGERGERRDLPRGERPDGR